VTVARDWQREMAREDSNELRENWRYTNTVLEFPTQRIKGASEIKKENTPMSWTVILVWPSLDVCSPFGMLRLFTHSCGLTVLDKLRLRNPLAHCWAA